MVCQNQPENLNNGNATGDVATIRQSNQSEVGCSAGHDITTVNGGGQVCRNSQENFNNGSANGGQLGGIYQTNKGEVACRAGHDISTVPSNNASTCANFSGNQNSGNATGWTAIIDQTNTQEVNCDADHSISGPSGSQTCSNNASNSNSGNATSGAAICTVVWCEAYGGSGSHDATSAITQQNQQEVHCEADVNITNACNNSASNTNSGNATATSTNLGDYSIRQANDQKVSCQAGSTIKDACNNMATNNNMGNASAPTAAYYKNTAGGPYSASILQTNEQQSSCQANTVKGSCNNVATNTNCGSALVTMTQCGQFSGGYGYTSSTITQRNEQRSSCEAQMVVMSCNNTAQNSNSGGTASSTPWSINQSNQQSASCDYEVAAMMSCNNVSTNQSTNPADQSQQQSVHCDGPTGSARVASCSNMYMNDPVAPSGNGPPAQASVGQNASCSSGSVSVASCYTVSAYLNPTSAVRPATSSGSSGRSSRATVPNAAVTRAPAPTRPTTVPTPVVPAAAPVANRHLVVLP
jgi:hypothetical protein